MDADDARPATKSIRIRAETKAVLDGLKIHPRESYSDVIRRLVRRAKHDSSVDPTVVAGLEQAVADLRAGRVEADALVGKAGQAG